MKKLWTFIISAFLVWAVVITTACPGKEKAEQTYRKGRELSAQMSIYGEKLIRANIDAFKAGEISQSQLAELNKATGAFVEAVRVYRAALDEAKRQIEAGVDSATATGMLSALFNERVVDAFFLIMEKLKLFPGANSETVKSIISGIRLTILAVQGAFSDARHLQKEVESWA